MTNSNKVRAGVASAKGAKRSNNEDRCLIRQNGAMLLDGISGSTFETGGLFAEFACLSWRRNPLGEHEADKLIERIDAEVASFATAAGIPQGGAAACAACWDSEGNLSISNVGDTMALTVNADGECRYLFRPERDSKERLYRYLGSRNCPSDYVSAYNGNVDWSSTFVVLMSDGVWEYVPSYAISSICKELSQSTQLIAERLVCSAQNHGSLDDASAIVLHAQ